MGVFVLLKRFAFVNPEDWKAHDTSLVLAWIARDDINEYQVIALEGGISTEHTISCRGTCPCFCKFPYMYYLYVHTGCYGCSNITRNTTRLCEEN